MDHLTSFLGDFNVFSASNYTFLLLIIPFLFLVILQKNKSKQPKLPPGPRPWPIIGNIPQVGQKPHVSMAQFARDHGPLISLRLGNLPVIVASSPLAAMEILKTHDRILSSRFVPSAFHHASLPSSSFLIWAQDCNDEWRSLRTLCQSELFSAKAIQSQSSLREEKMAQMLEFLASKEGQAVKIAEVVFTTVFNMLSSVIFSKDFLNYEDEQGTAGGLRGTLFQILKLGITPNIGDFYPMFKSFDLQGLRKRILKHSLDMFSVWEYIINERRESKDIGSSEKHKFLDKMLANGFTNVEISVLALELFTAGTDTTTSTVEWTMSELIKNEEAMSKVREELKKEINSGSFTESQLSKLTYLNACIKEALRLHPAAPFLVPHRALDTCEVMNYTIPKDSQVLVNVYAIGRDPEIWEDPLSFKPERFLDSNLDFKGQDFEFIPFGAGRRMCPGLPSGSKQVQFILASLINRFDWHLPNNEDPLKLDMNDKFGVTLQREKPLQIIPKKK